MSESTFIDSSVGTVGSRVVAYNRQYERTNERKGTSYPTIVNIYAILCIFLNLFQAKMCIQYQVVLEDPPGRFRAKQLPGTTLGRP